MVVSLKLAPLQLYYDHHHHHCFDPSLFDCCLVFVRRVVVWQRAEQWCEGWARRRWQQRRLHLAAQVHTLQGYMAIDRAAVAAARHKTIPTLAVVHIQTMARW